MNSPLIRLVCGDCLQSVEVTTDGTKGLPASCPFCGGTFESRVEELEPPPSGLATPLTLDLTPEDVSPADVTVELKNRAGLVDRFQLRETLGGGGFGNVHRAYDPRLDREIALKVLKQPRPGSRAMERFFREARAAARLDHPHIVALYDAGRDGDRCWIAYQFIAGRTLSSLREYRTPSMEESVRIVRSLADALDHAHRRGVFHRDLKPSNVIIDEAGRPRLTDFGLAKRQDYESTLTREGTVLGTPAYMSPEQAEGNSHLADARSDLYSLGVILYELLCGRRPSELPSGVPIWRAVQAPPAPPPRSVNPSIPRELDRICQRALARDPADRYPDAQAMATDLDHWLGRRRRVADRGLLLGAGASGLLVAVIGMKLATFVTGGPRPIEVAVAAEPGPQSPAQKDGAPGSIRAPSSLATPAPAGGETPVRPVPEAAASSTRVVGNADSHLYHLPDSKHATVMSDKNRREFEDAEAAEAAAFTACKECFKSPRARSDSPEKAEAPGT